MVDKNKGTVIVVNAFTELGHKALALQKADEESLRKSYVGVPRWRQPSKVRSYLKSVSAYTSSEVDGLPMRHEILGFSVLNQQQRSYIYEGIKKAFLDNGCSLNDFEVTYRD